MASCVAQTQGAPHSRLGPRRLSADGALGCPCATERLSDYKGLWGVGPSPGGGRDLLYQLGLGIPCGQGA